MCLCLCVWEGEGVYSAASTVAAGMYFFFSPLPFAASTEQKYFSPTNDSAVSAVFERG